MTINYCCTHNYFLAFLEKYEQLPDFWVIAHIYNINPGLPGPFFDICLAKVY